MTRVCYISAILLGLGSLASAQESPAVRLCQVIDKTNVNAEPCRVDAANATVWARMKMGPAEAKGFCDQLSTVILDSKVRFGGAKDWRLAIQSPASGDDSIAVCNLPR